MKKYKLLNFDNPSQLIGNKAANLFRLHKNGFPVLPGIVAVVDNEGDEAALLAEKIQFDWPLILRSSSVYEDSSRSSCAGCFNSVGPVKNPADFVEGLAFASSVTPRAQKILNNENLDKTPPAVLIQSWQDFVSRGVLFYPDPWGNDECSIQTEISGKTSQFGEEEKEKILKYARRIREFFNWEVLDLEWGIKDDGTVVVLQARKLLSQGRILPRAMQQGTWLRDRTHNPDPLSRLHTSLIKYVRQIYSGIETWNRYLFFEKKEGEKQNIATSELKKEIARLEIADSLSKKLPVFASFISLYLSSVRLSSGNYQNIIAGKLRNLLSQVEAPEEVISQLKSLREGEINFAELPAQLKEFFNFISVFPLVWDLSSETWGDRLSELVARVIDLISVIAASEASFPPDSDKGISEKEYDDFLFAQALHKLREEILAVGERLVAKEFIAERDDVFELSLEEIFEYLDVEGFDIAVESGKRETPLLSGWIPPDKVENGSAVYKQIPPPTSSSRLRGIPLIPRRSRGKAVFSNNLNRLEGPLIFVGYSLKPQDILLLTEVSGIVLETEEKLSHGVIIARELGIPTLIGVKNITSQVKEGDYLNLLADIGIVDINV
ncbi:MAG: PEP-utilizing enzyme [Deltaproteobacteria bacterium]|jgi:phosphohistidine swiveling domain-containing protein|nr:PEP-utilizing enzyme [Deltaproteobacteria bacterium]